MPDGLSGFTPCGMLELTSEPSHAEVIYLDLVRALGTAPKGGPAPFDMSPGTRMEAWAYALAMALGCAQYALDRAGNQAHPLSAWDLIPLLERGYLVVPGPDESVGQRAATLAAIDALQAGATFPTLATALRQQLGAAFLALVPVGTVATPTQWPPAPSSGGGNWVDPRTPQLPIALAEAVTPLGSPQWVAYTWLDPTRLVSTAWLAGTYALGAAVVPTAPNVTGYQYQCTTAGKTGTTEPLWPTVVGQTVTDGAAVWTCASPTVPQLQVGQTVTIQGECTASIERVTVEGVSLSAQGTAAEGPCFLATFTQPHDAGASISTGAFPYWGSYQRCLYVVLTAAAAADRETRRKLDEYLRKAVRGVDSWAILAATGTTVTDVTWGTVSAGNPMGTATFGQYTATRTP